MTCDRVTEIATCVMAFFVNLTCDMGKNTGRIHVTSFCLFFFFNSTCDIAPPPIYLAIEWDSGLAGRHSGFSYWLLVQEMGLWKGFHDAERETLGTMIIGLYCSNAKFFGVTYDRNC